MSTIIFAVVTQAIPFLPLALAISISYCILRATDMTLDGSFVLGAVIFARLILLGYPPIIASFCALLGGALAGIMVSLIQRNGKIDSLLAGILATFILASGNLILMGKPNINLLSQTTLLSNAFSISDTYGWITTGLYSAGICILALLIIKSKTGLTLRALGDNPNLLKRLGKNVEAYRMFGFALTNMLAASAGCLTAQTLNYADINMGVGMTLTGIGAILLGQQIIRVISKKSYLRVLSEFIACLIGVLFYFTAISMLLRFDINPIYIKLILGLVLILFLRTAVLHSPRNLT